MRAWLIEAVTDAGTMVFTEVADPVPAPGEVLVRVEVAGVNFLDTLMVRGRYQRKPLPPFTPGIEVAGRVVGTGQRVLASPEWGGYAELVAVPEAALTPIPDDVPSEAALVLLGVNYPTAHYALHHRARLQPGETVLVHAAAGGVGSAAVQLARAAGARVIATAGCPAKRDTCTGLGAHLVLDPADPAWTDQVRAAGGVDVVFDPVGGDLAVAGLRCLNWHARHLVIGFAAGAIPALPANRLLLREASAIGVLWGELRTRDPALAATVTSAVLGLYRQGRLDPLIGARFPLDRADHALNQLATRQTVGKVVLLP